MTYLPEIKCGNCRYYRHDKGVRFTDQGCAAGDFGNCYLKQETKRVLENDKCHWFAPSITLLTTNPGTA